MSIAFRMGRYGVRLAKTEADVAACQALRHQCFFGSAGVDDDGYDGLCDHLMIADPGGLVATCRLRQLSSGATISKTYAGARYDLRRLAGYDRPMLELGRFCVADHAQDADALRLLWGSLTQIVDAADIGMLFGCTSFPGVDPAVYHAGFGVLARRHLAPSGLAPCVAAKDIVRLDPAAASAEGRVQLPVLLRSYLSMGGWVSDHAVVDHQMQTMHVFTALQTADIPARRAASLRAMCG